MSKNTITIQTPKGVASVIASARRAERAERVEAMREGRVQHKASTFATGRDKDRRRNQKHRVDYRYAE